MPHKYRHILNINNDSQVTSKFIKVEYNKWTLVLFTVNYLIKLTSDVNDILFSYKSPVIVCACMIINYPQILHC